MTGYAEAGANGYSDSSGYAALQSQLWEPPGVGDFLRQHLRAGNWDTTLGEISQWHDSSGFDAHATQPVGLQQPTDTIDSGLRVARLFSANNDHLIADALAPAVFAGVDQPFSVYMLARRVSGTGSPWGVGNSASNNANIQFSWPEPGAPTRYRLYRKDDVNFALNRNVTDPPPDTDFHVVGCLFSGTAWNFRVDGVDRVINPAPSADVGNITADRFTIGGIRLSTAFGFANPSDLALHEFLVWDEHLLPVEIAAVEAALLPRLPP